jgi:hypothetical protein
VAATTNISIIGKVMTIIRPTATHPRSTAQHLALAHERVRFIRSARRIISNRC